MEDNLGLAMAALRMSPDEFFDLTPRAFQLAMKAYNQLQEQQSKLQLEAARFSGWLAARPGMSEEAQNRYWCPQKYYPFTWDPEIKEPEKKKPTEAHMEKARKWLLEE